MALVSRYLGSNSHRHCKNCGEGAQLVAGYEEKLRQKDESNKRLDAFKQAGQGSG